MQTAAPKHNQTKIKDADTIINTTNFTIPEETNKVTARERDRERERERDNLNTRTEKELIFTIKKERKENLYDARE